MGEGPAADADLSPGIRRLLPSECREILARNRLCVMAVVDGEEPYAVPLYYGFDGDAIYLGVAHGRKTRALDRNPRVCVVVVETGSAAEWRSVELAGRAIVLAGPDREQGLAVLVAHNRRFRERVGGLSERAAPPRSGGRVLRIEEGVLSGRATTADASGPRPAGSPAVP